jgi:hypothetical protein
MIQMFAYGLEEAWTAEYKKEARVEPADPFVRQNDGRVPEGLRRGPRGGVQVGQGPHASDKILLRDGTEWFVPLVSILMPHSEDEAVDQRGQDVHIAYDSQLDYWFEVESGHVCKWGTYNGNRVPRGTPLDNLVNRHYEDEGDD